MARLSTPFLVGENHSDTSMQLASWLALGLRINYRMATSALAAPAAPALCRRGHTRSPPDVGPLGGLACWPPVSDPRRLELGKPRCAVGRAAGADRGASRGAAPPRQRHRDTAPPLRSSPLPAPAPIPIPALAPAPGPLHLPPSPSPRPGPDPCTGSRPAPPQPRPPSPPPSPGSASEPGKGGRSESWRPEGRRGRRRS
ncbi:vegetative cell wall protein gp1-like [Corvus hawaiiensis]|uniref:vegetative cell wall protein gp1-like n=1 Tax=Corvus hawaiiensis TaxID=134902 RepID=UPI0020187F20|nr:vegetative cell wall protein gp1-like [Corvus hawaiiensis]